MESKEELSACISDVNWTSAHDCVHGTYVDAEQPLPSGTAVAAFDEVMFWCRQLDKDTILSIYEYSVGKNSLSRSRKYPLL